MNPLQTATQILNILQLQGQADLSDYICHQTRLAYGAYIKPLLTCFSVIMVGKNIDQG